MKKILLLFVVFAILASCSNDDDATNNPVVGQWKLMRAEINGVVGPSTFDFSDQNVIYDFRQDGTLIVVGGENTGFYNGEYEYFFGEDYIGLPTDPKVLMVKLDGSKLIYSLTDGEMKLGMSYIDGADLFFVRK